VSSRNQFFKSKSKSESKLSYDRRSANQTACLGVRPQSGPVTNFSVFSLKFSLGSCWYVILWRPLWRGDGSVIYCCCLASPAQSLSGVSPAGLKTLFYCPNFLHSPNLEGQVPVFIFPREQSGPVIPPGTGFPFRRLLPLAGLRWGYYNPPPNGSISNSSRSRSYFTTDSQSVSMYPYGTCEQILLPVGTLSSEICGLVAVGHPPWREDGFAICSAIIQWSESRRTRNHTLLSHLRLPQPGGSGYCIYIPQEQVGIGFQLFWSWDHVATDVRNNLFNYSSKSTQALSK
jgi:hypothetical protein